jgi:hypothetical protein
MASRAFPCRYPFLKASLKNLLRLVTKPPFDRCDVSDRASYCSSLWFVMQVVGVAAVVALADALPLMSLKPPLMQMLLMRECWPHLRMLCRVDSRHFLADASPPCSR